MSGEHEQPESEMDIPTEEEWNEAVVDLCQSKAEEFRLIGYEHVTGDDVWNCVKDKYRKTGFPKRHQIVNDILSLRVMDFMNWLTLSVYKPDVRF